MVRGSNWATNITSNNTRSICNDEVQTIALSYALCSLLLYALCIAAGIIHCCVHYILLYALRIVVCITRCCMHYALLYSLCTAVCIVVVVCIILVVCIVICITCCMHYALLYTLWHCSVHAYNCFTQEKLLLCAYN